MLDQLILWERELFLSLNNFHTPFLDAFMYLISARWTWTAVVIALILWVFYKRSPKEAILFIIVAVLMHIVCDQMVSSFIKPLFGRLRPAYHPYTKEAVMNVYKDLGWGFSFVSGHAANFFAIALFTALSFRDRWYTLIVFLLATLVAYSRVYLGVHFLSDIIPGAIIGLLLGYLFYRLYIFSRSKVLGKSKASLPHKVFQNNIAVWRTIVLGYLFFMVAFSLEMSKALIRIGYYG
ncbi:phosphatase PAP2 family protein [Porphyromonas circumdentaria]|uniref:Undecaprenyl-diphosphatase n=1 Tax=Porphyromonas circumdentaria TaxID=29524 RepID=A0A1T4LFF5_9PORP|nr:phosphatase PAP2 family protein [Porphyromonas circumdentaria]MBB6275281.1 undecaprenyl-diphosphatase [Porphyromonas circumdentaria]MDO4722040.1 phosphatase PAP2 family protein [Porphyromonas circumdentaria]SJZ53298.1 undecaprenyl-diphosphatase [Porphyromonas circumdentaria]